jgi:hypothetical protein
MSLFGNKSAGKTASKVAGAADSNGGPVAHRFTLDLSRAHGLAMMVANSRSSKFVEISDLIAGMYLYEWDRLSEYWPEENRDEVEETLREICRISPQRWNSWIQLYDAKRKEPQSRWEKIKTKALRQKMQPKEVVPETSAGLRVILETAEQISPFYDKTDEREIPILTMECVLFCVVQATGSELGKKLRETGLDVALLERAALDPKRSPRR